jgi:hypothetical protein
VKTLFFEKLEFQTRKKQYAVCTEISYKRIERKKVRRKWEKYKHSKEKKDKCGKDGCT